MSEDKKFWVIDKKTGKEPTSRVIDNIAKKGGLMRLDIDQFFVGEDGALVLVDDCGNATYCDPNRFKVRFSEEIMIAGTTRKDRHEAVKYLAAQKAFQDGKYGEALECAIQAISTIDLIRDVLRTEKNAMKALSVIYILVDGERDDG